MLENKIPQDLKMFTFIKQVYTQKSTNKKYQNKNKVISQRV